jgi:hypothetical protein
VAAEDLPFGSGWLPLVERTVACGVKVRRARVVSEPVTVCVRFERALTGAGLRAGEEVRWLPCRRASTLALAGSGFWFIGDQVVRWNLFCGDGRALEPGHTEDRQAVVLCAGAFRSVWDLAVGRFAGP